MVQLTEVQLRSVQNGPRVGTQLIIKNLGLISSTMRFMIKTARTYLLNWEWAEITYNWWALLQVVIGSKSRFNR